MKPILTLVALSALLITTAFAAKRYPLDYCVVTDNELGSMGKVITKVYGDQQIKFCCKPCVAKFEKNPAKYLAKLP
jgi:hypothetical protein